MQLSHLMTRCFGQRSLSRTLGPKRARFTQDLASIDDVLRNEHDVVIKHSLRSGLHGGRVVRMRIISVVCMARLVLRGVKEDDTRTEYSAAVEISSGMFWGRLLRARVLALRLADILLIYQQSKTL